MATDSNLSNVKNAEALVMFQLSNTASQARRRKSRDALAKNKCGIGFEPGRRINLNICGLLRK